MSEERHISFDTYLKALALFMMAAEHYSKCQQFQGVLEGLLGVGDCGHIPDALYDNNPGRAHFDEALKREGILVQPPESE